MKKKAIEKIPYLGLPQVIQTKKVKYVGVTALKNVAHERHLFLEVYKNDREHKKIPEVRIVLTKKDFGTYFPDVGEWTRQKCLNYYSCNDLIWYRNGAAIDRNALDQENILYSPEDLERIKKYLKDVVLWRDNKWWYYIKEVQEYIVSSERVRRQARKEERRRQGLKEREAATPDFPVEDVLSYARWHIFRDTHYLYYKKNGRRARVACTSCGGVSEGKWKAGESYESQFEHLMEEPRAGILGTCPMCGTKGIYMAQGRLKGSYEKTGYLFLGQKYKETGMVFRYVQVFRNYEIQLIDEGKGPELYNAGESTEAIEIARAYFEEGRKPQIDYHKHSPFNGEDFWDDCNLYGMANISIKEAPIMPETYRNMQGTFLQYSALQAFETAVGDVNAIDYMKHYIRTPQIEMLVKMHLIGVVQELVHYDLDILYNDNAKSVDACLGIRKEKVKLLMGNQGNTDLLRIMQIEKRLGQNWTDEQIRNMAEIGIDYHRVELTLQYMTIQKMLNRVAKYAGCEYGTGCSKAEGRLKQMARYYFDYLDMRLQLGYDLGNTVYQQPRNLSEAHNKMVAESNAIERKKKAEAAARQYPLIRKQYRSLRREFFFEDDEFLIRPARSAEEIMEEGRYLHHCVGGEQYLYGHNQGESIILFLRYSKNPEIPYITVQMDRNYHIVQWHGTNNRQPDKEKMQKWLNNYVTRLKCGGLDSNMTADDGEVRRQALA